MTECFFIKATLVRICVLGMFYLVVNDVIADDAQSSNPIPFKDILPSVFRLMGPERSEFSANGTAWIVHPSGIAIASNHVVDDIVNPIRQHHGRLISFDDNVYNYQVIGFSPQHDMAFLKVSGGNSYKAIPVARHVLEQGEQIGGVWNFDNMALVCTQGIYSGKVPGHTDHLVNISMLLFDMPHNPGGSGGPIVAAKGGVVAITAGSGRGFTVGYSSADILSALNSVANSRAIYGLATGMTVVNDPKNDSGVLVVSAKKDSAAENVGIAAEDRIIAIGEWAVDSPLDFELSSLAWMQDYPGQPIPMTVKKKSDQEETTVRLTPLLEAIPRAKVDVQTLNRQGCVVVFKNEEEKELSHDFTDALDVSRFNEKGEILFEGFLSIPHEGSYVFSLNTAGAGTMTLRGEGEDWIVEKSLCHPELHATFHSKRGYFEQGIYRFSLRINNVVEGQNVAEGEKIPLVFVETGMSPERKVLPKEWLLRPE